MLRFIKQSVIAASAERVFAFHEGPDAFARLLPPRQERELITPPAFLGGAVSIAARGHAPSLRSTAVTQRPAGSARSADIPSAAAAATFFS